MVYLSISLDTTHMFQVNRYTVDGPFGNPLPVEYIICIQSTLWDDQHTLNYSSLSRGRSIG